MLSVHSPVITQISQRKYSSSAFSKAYFNKLKIFGIGPSVNSTARVAARAMGFDVVISKPFAVVDEITEASLVAEDGLQLGDQVVEFGENLRKNLLLKRRKVSDVQYHGGFEAGCSD